MNEPLTEAPKENNQDFFIAGVKIDFTNFDFLTKLKLDKIIYSLTEKYPSREEKRLMIYEGFYKHCKCQECIKYLAEEINKLDIKDLYFDIILELLNTEIN